MIPPAIGLFSALLKERGHQVEIFDSTYYAIDYGIDSDGSQVDKLSVVPFKMEERGIRLRTTDWVEDLKKQIQFIVDIYKSGNLKEAEVLSKKLINTHHYPQ